MEHGTWDMVPAYLFDSTDEVEFTPRLRFRYIRLEGEYRILPALFPLCAVKNSLPFHPLRHHLRIFLDTASLGGFLK